MANPKILVVEDDDDIRTVLMDQLKLDGFETVGASTGTEVLEGYNVLAPDLIILDLKLPDIDGLVVCQEIRKRSDVPIIIVSARDSLPDKIRGLELGADDYVTKPFEYLELEARIRACLRRRKSVANQDPLDLGSLKVFRKKRMIEVNGKSVNLTKKEYELLNLFLENRGQVLSREFLSSHLWNKKEVYPWSRALDVHVRRLRKKIEPDPANPTYILTHAGVGYRFAAD
ncbi:MAG: response regulator transcription factor [Thermodesulfobacteria bacterium]|nr:response regulator transcription factor [Thermodesulfobacteriota bacterium]